MDDREEEYRRDAEEGYLYGDDDYASRPVKKCAAAGCENTLLAGDPRSYCVLCDWPCGTLPRRSPAADAWYRANMTARDYADMLARDEAMTRTYLRGERCRSCKRMPAMMNVASGLLLCTNCWTCYGALRDAHSGLGAAREGEYFLTDHPELWGGDDGVGDLITRFANAYRYGM